MNLQGIQSLKTINLAAKHLITRCKRIVSKWRFDIIYVNHLLRAAYPSMVQTAEMILTNKRSLEADDNLISIKEILNLIPGT